VSVCVLESICPCLCLWVVSVCWRVLKTQSFAGSLNCCISFVKDTYFCWALLHERPKNIFTTKWQGRATRRAAYTYTQRHTHTTTQTQTQTQTQTCTSTRTHTRTRTRTNTRTEIHTHTYAHTRTHTHVHTQTHAHQLAHELRRRKTQAAHRFPCKFETENKNRTQ